MHPGPASPTPTQLPVLGVSGPAVATQGQACFQPHRPRLGGPGMARVCVLIASLKCVQTLTGLRVSHPPPHSIPALWWPASLLPRWEIGSRWKQKASPEPDLAVHLSGPTPFGGRQAGRGCAVAGGQRTRSLPRSPQSGGWRELASSLPAQPSPGGSRQPSFSRARLQVISGAYRHRPLPRAVLSFQSKQDPSQSCREKLTIPPVSCPRAPYLRGRLWPRPMLLRNEAGSPGLAAHHCSPPPATASLRTLASHWDCTMKHFLTWERRLQRSKGNSQEQGLEGRSLVHCISPILCELGDPSPL